METTDFYLKSIQSIQEFTKKPDDFLETNNKLCDNLRNSLKNTYDFAKDEEIKKIKSNALPELIVKGFDLEQIWQQIELQNDSLLTHSLANVSKLIVGKNKLFFRNQLVSLPLENDPDGSSSEDGQMEADEPLARPLGENQEDNDSEIDFNDQLSTEDEDDKRSIAEEEPAKGKKSIVDDDFFKLDEMEQFLNAEEKKLAEPDSGNDTEEDDSDDEGGDKIDYFEADSEDENNTVRTAKYKDFFVQQDQQRRDKPRRNKMLEGLDLAEDGAAEPKSTFEQRQERLDRRIEELEEVAISEKPWQLLGEITAEKRPYNSLLEEVVDFDLTSRPAPIMTEKTTLQLDDIIKQRIKDKVFDSVERKAKPVETPLEYKKKLLLNQEKSKESLAQIYEREYLDQKAALDPEQAEKEEEVPKLHTTIDGMISNLFRKLDSLSNFHFTPKMAVPELKVVNNLPAIAMEEVAPVAASDAALLAPEEIQNKAKGDLLGKDERTDTDKKRERRKKKLKQKIHVKEKEKRDAMVKKMKPGLGNKYSKAKMNDMLTKVTKDRNVDRMDESGKGVKSSTAFFSQLEDQVKSQIKGKSAPKANKKKNVFDAKKLKL